MQIADQVAEDVSEQDDARNGHHYFLSDAGLIKADGAVQLTGCRSGTHVDFSGSGESNRRLAVWNDDAAPILPAAAFVTFQYTRARIPGGTLTIGPK